MSENEFLPGSIRERIVDLKRMTNVNNKTIAEKTGISESLLSRIESGKQQSVSDDVVLKLAKFFGVSTDFLLGRTNVPDKKNYTIEELGLSAQAARSLYTGSVDVSARPLLRRIRSINAPQSCSAALQGKTAIGGRKRRRSQNRRVRNAHRFTKPSLHRWPRSLKKP